MLSDKLEEIEWRYDKGIDLFHEDMTFLIEQAKKVEQYEKLIDKTLYLLGTEDYYEQGVVEQIQAELAMSFGEIRNSY